MQDINEANHTSKALQLVQAMFFCLTVEQKSTALEEGKKTQFSQLVENNNSNLTKLLNSFTHTLTQSESLKNFLLSFCACFLREEAALCDRYDYGSLQVIPKFWVKMYEMITHAPKLNWTHAVEKWKPCFNELSEKTEFDESMNEFNKQMIKLVSERLTDIRDVLANLGLAIFTANNLAYGHLTHDFKWTLMRDMFFVLPKAKFNRYTYESFQVVSKTDNFVKEVSYQFYKLVTEDTWKKCNLVKAMKMLFKLFCFPFVPLEERINKVNSLLSMYQEAISKFQHRKESYESTRNGFAESLKPLEKCTDWQKAETAMQGTIEFLRTTFQAIEESEVSVVFDDAIRQIMLIRAILNFKPAN